MSDEAEQVPEPASPKKDKKKNKKKEKGGGKKSKKKLILFPILLLLVAGVGYKMVLAPKPKAPVKKIAGELFQLEKEFIVNLDEGHYGKVSVALVVEGAVVGKHGIELPQEPAVRAIITDELTGLKSTDLTDRTSREAVIERILDDIKKSTDEPVTEVLFTDLAVQ